jgi:hypothetical protein
MKYDVIVVGLEAMPLKAIDALQGSFFVIITI